MRGAGLLLEWTHWVKKIDNQSVNVNDFLKRTVLLYI